jgi:hypothetical protein
VYLCLSLFYAPWYLVLLSVPLFLYNLRSFMRRDHKLYFITGKEYGRKSFQLIENQFKWKSAYYGILTATNLVMMILALIDFMERLI